MLQLRGALAQRRVGLLRALDRAGAGLHQVVVAGLFFLREFQIGFGGGDIGGALLDDRLLQGDLRIEVAHRGLGGGDIGMGLVERRPEIAVVDPGQQLAGLDRLVVADQHLRDVAGDLWRDDRGVRPSHRRRRSIPGSGRW